MKSIVIFLLFTATLIQPLASQTIFWEENFNDSIPGWTLEDHWIHTPGKLHFDGTSAGNAFDYSALSPVIEIDINASQLIINQYIEIWDFDANDGIAEIAIRSGPERLVVWNHDLSDGDWGWYTGTNLMLDVSEYQGMDIQIEFRTFGDPDFIFYNWRIFNILCYTNFNNDLAITEFSGPSNLQLNEVGTWEFTVSNLGYLAQDEYYLSLIDYKTGEVLEHFIVNETIEPTEEKSFEIQWSSQTHMNTVVYVDIGLVNDDFPFNNKSPNLFVRIEPDEAYDIFVWDNDNTVQTIYDPETGDWVGAEAGIVRALQNAGISFAMGLELPENLMDYEIVFCTLGPWCES